MFLKSINQVNPLGMNLVELLTTVTVVGVLSVVGIRTYKSQIHKSRMAEAKQTLSFIYTSEKSFKETWGTYHENLMAIGVVPEGSFYYDAGFGYSVSLSNTDGNLNNFPGDVKASLNIRECTNFHQICQGSCITQTRSAVGAGSSSYFSYFSSSGCRVTGGSYVKDYTGSHASAAKAEESEFKALAIGRLKTDDIWSINQNKTVRHEKDGSN